MWSIWTFSERLPSSGKREGDACDGQQASQQLVSPPTVVVAAVKKHVTVIPGEIGNVTTEIMLDSGSSLSLVQQVMIPGMSNVEPHTPQPSLVTASGIPCPLEVTQGH